MAHRILLVDDSATVQQLVKLAFSGEGIEVEVAASGAAAKEHLRSNIPDLILADISLPEDGTFELLQFVRSYREFSSTPLILLVKAGAPLDLQEVRRKGADGVLTKPFESMKTLVETVRGSIGHRAQAFEFEEGDSILEVDDPGGSHSAITDRISDSLLDDLATRLMSRLIDQLTQEVVARAVPEVQAIVTRSLSEKSRVPNADALGDIDEAREITDD